MKLPTKKDFEAGITPENRSYRLGLLEKMAADGLGMGEDDPIWDVKYIEQITDKINELNKMLAEVEDETKTINRRQEALQMKLSDFPELFMLKNEIKPQLQLWETVTQYNSMIEQWKEKPISKITIEEYEDFINEWYRKLLFVMRSSKLAKHKGPAMFANFIMREIETIRDYLPVLQCLKVKGLDRRHI